MEFFVDLSDLVIVLFAGLIGAFIGFVEIKSFSKRKKIVKRNFFIAVTCSALFFIIIAGYGVSVMHKNTDITNIMAQIKEQRMFSVLFSYNKDAEAEVREVVSNALDSYSGEEAMFNIFNSIGSVSEKYFSRYVLSASDEAVYNMLKRNLVVMKKFKNKPELCINYYLGKTNFENSGLSEEFVAKEFEIREAVIKSAIDVPSKIKGDVDVKSVVEELSRAYIAKGYGIEDIFSIGQIDVMKPEDACGVAIKFTDVIVSMPSEKAVQLFRKLLYVSTDNN